MTLYARIANTLSWVAAGAFFVFGIAAMGSVVSSGGNAFAGAVSMIVTWIAGFFVWLWIRIVPELFQLLMRIERNTHKEA